MKIGTITTLHHIRRFNCKPKQVQPRCIWRTFHETKLRLDFRTLITPQLRAILDWRLLHGIHVVTVDLFSSLHRTMPLLIIFMMKLTIRKKKIISTLNVVLDLMPGDYYFQFRVIDDLSSTDPPSVYTFSIQVCLVDRRFIYYNHSTFNNRRLLDLVFLLQLALARPLRLQLH